jgi:hypothetical protein
MSFPNVWHHRRVADTSAKPCDVCYKPSSSVLLNPHNKDFFYICPVHLKDGSFCTPIIDTEIEAAKEREEAIAREIEKVKNEYEQKQRKKEKEQNNKQKEKGNSQEKKGEEKDRDQGGLEETKDDIKSTNNDQKEKNDTVKSVVSEPKADDPPRIFALHKTFYQMRIDRIRNIEISRRNRERLKNSAAFPSVPNGDF